MTWITAIGLLAATLTTSAFIPQAVKVIRTKQTEDLSLGMYTIMNIGVVCWLTYGILLQDIPLVVANTITLIFTATILVMKIKYK